MSATIQVSTSESSKWSSLYSGGEAPHRRGDTCSRGVDCASCAREQGQRQPGTHRPERDGCPECGGQLRHFGDDVSEQLEYVPESFKVIRHVRPKFACTGCNRVVEAPSPSRPIERGLAGPGLLAHVIFSKYADHLPLFRRSEIYARQGVVISRSTPPDGSVQPVICSVLWWRPSASMFLPVASSMRTIRPYRCLRPATARPRPAVYGRMYAMKDRRANRPLLPSGSPTRKIAEENIRGSI